MQIKGKIRGALVGRPLVESYCLASFALAPFGGGVIGFDMVEARGYLLGGT